MCLASPTLAAERGYLDVWLGDIPAPINGIRNGVVLKNVFAGMAADRAGLKPGQIVTQINGVDIRDSRDGVALLAENEAGEKIRLTVVDTKSGRLRQSYVFATMDAQPTGKFAEIMVVPHAPHRRAAPSSNAPHCTDSGGMRNRPCPAYAAPMQ